MQHNYATRCNTILQHVPSQLQRACQQRIRRQPRDLTRTRRENAQERKTPRTIVCCSMTGHCWRTTLLKVQNGSQQRCAIKSAANLHPVGKVSAPSLGKQITMGRCAFRMSQKSVQNYANQHGTLCASNHLFRLMFGVFYGSKIRNHIVDAASMQSLFQVILRYFVEKRNGTQVSPRLQSK